MLESETIRNTIVTDYSTSPGLRVSSRLTSLYERGKEQQWDTGTDLDWKVDSGFGSALQEDSNFAIACFEASPLARYGRPIWETFRWEFQSWMVSQFLPGEQAALLSANRLAAAVPDSEARLCLSAQAVDEARHVEVFERYLREKVPAPYPVSSSLALLLQDTISDRRWDINVLGMQILVETVALAAFRLADRSFHDKLIREICRRVAQDESRHVSFGVLTLSDLYADLPESELKEREEFVIESLSLIRQRFLLEEIWDRMGIKRTEGIAFATTSPLMIQYRQTICTNLISSLIKIGLATHRLGDRLIHLNLLGARHRLWFSHAQR